jgi:lipopolysaccharide/colanic/teichoic acid biosynthesis glycosyltransferase
MSVSAAQNALPIMIPADIISDRVFLFISDSPNPISTDYQLASIHCYQETSQNGFYKLWNGDIHPDVVLLISPDSDYIELLKLLNEQNIPVIYYSSRFDLSLKEVAIRLQVDDYLYGSINEDFIKHVDLLRKIKALRSSFKKDNQALGGTSSLLKSQLPSKKMWRLKRTIDIFASLLGLIILSPIMLLIAIAVKIESKGPVFYISKRSGSGYKVFDFYKFRTMRQGSDEELKNLQSSNQYGSEGGKAIFFKIKNDPRITRLGQFLRNTSLDELPQLFNVLKGDMSLVGNRPLPLYEAEQLTRDLIAARFLAPAGITGLWQVTKRGKENMSPEERIQLDIEYALKNSFLFDMKILLKTFFAVFQKEKV